MVKYIDEEEKEIVESAIGEMYNTFQIVDVLGIGGMAYVYKAVHKEIETMRLAIKVLNWESAHNANIAKRFKHEIEAVCSLMHPNIIDVRDYGRIIGWKNFRNNPYIVMECCEGQDLGEILKERGRITMGYVVKYILETASALDYAHKNKIIHRDIKPQNLMVAGGHGNPDAQIKLLDFGVAYLQDHFAMLDEKRGEASDRTKLTEVGQTPGTVAYMAPEAAEEIWDSRTDVYALAVTTYELITGKVPFDGVSLKISAQKREKTAPLLRDKLEFHVPDAIEKVLAKGLEKNINARYATAGDFALDLILAVYENVNSLPPELSDNITEKWVEITKTSVQKNSFSSFLLAIHENPDSFPEKIKDAIISKLTEEAKTGAINKNFSLLQNGTLDQDVSDTNFLQSQLLKSGRKKALLFLIVFVTGLSSWILGKKQGAEGIRSEYEKAIKEAPASQVQTNEIKKTPFQIDPSPSSSEITPILNTEKDSRPTKPKSSSTQSTAEVKTKAKKKKEPNSSNEEKSSSEKKSQISNNNKEKTSSTAQDKRKNDSPTLNSPAPSQKQGLTAEDYLLLGRNALRRDNVEEAIRSLKESTRLAPRSAKAWLLLAEAYEKANKNQKAALAYRRYLRISPKSKKATSIQEKIKQLSR